MDPFWTCLLCGVHAAMHYPLRTETPFSRVAQSALGAADSQLSFSPRIALGATHVTPLPGTAHIQWLVDTADKGLTTCLSEEQKQKTVTAPELLPDHLRLLK